MIVDRFPEINRKMVAAAFAMVSSAILALPAMAQTPATPKKAKPLATYEAIGAFTDPRITESSGVVMAAPAAAPEAPLAFWTFNDSGGKPRLFRVELPGKTSAAVTLQGAKNLDWESMCALTVGQQRYLAVGDVGDNARRRKDYQIHICAEPMAPFAKEVPCRTLNFQYEDGPHNCEAISYNAADNSFWLVEKVYLTNKRKQAPGIYRLANPLTGPNDKPPAERGIAKKIGTFNVRNVTGMAFSPDQTKLVVRSYFACYLFDKAAGKSWQETVSQSKPKTILCPIQSIGESICFATDSQSMLLTSELAKATLWKIIPTPVAAPIKEKSE